VKNKDEKPSRSRDSRPKGEWTRKNLLTRKEWGQTIFGIFLIGIGSFWIIFSIIVSKGKTGWDLLFGFIWLLGLMGMLIAIGLTGIFDALYQYSADDSDIRRTTEKPGKKM